MGDGARVVVDFRTDPSRYRHWKLSFDGPVATLTADDADVLGADWDPTGTYLIFSSDRAGAISIWRIAARLARASRHSRAATRFRR